MIVILNGFPKQSWDRGFFLLMNNDLKFVTASNWKYVDDTSVAEIVKKGDCSTIQRDAELVQIWSCENKLQLNIEKCKEMIIDFTAISSDSRPPKFEMLDINNCF